MLTIEETKTALNRPDMSDEEAEEIRVGLQSLVDIIFEKWMADRKNTIIN